MKWSGVVLKGSFVFKWGGGGGGGGGAAQNVLLR